MAVANSSNISTIQILRSYANSAPDTLADGQLAYSFVSNTLFIGSNTGVISIGDPSTASIARSAQSNTIYTQGVDTTQNTAITSTDGKMQSAYDQANTGTVLAQAAFNAANNVFPQIQPSFNVANSASANTIITQGVDVTQNTRLTVLENTNTSQNVRLDYSNTAITIIQGVDTSQNARIAIIEGVDVTQNTNIASTDGKMQSAYNQANTGTVLAQAAFDTANNAGINASNLTSGTLPAARLPASGVSAQSYGDSINIPSVTVDATGRITSALNTVVRTGSTSQTGVLQLIDSTSSTSTTTAATPNSVKTTYDLATARAAINPGAPKTGDIQVSGSVISVYNGTSWLQIYPAIYS